MDDVNESMAFRLRPIQCVVGVVLFIFLMPITCYNVMDHHNVVSQRMKEVRYQYQPFYYNTTYDKHTRDKNAMRKSSSAFITKYIASRNESNYEGLSRNNIFYAKDARIHVVNEIENENRISSAQLKERTTTKFNLDAKRNVLRNNESVAGHRARGPHRKYCIQCQIIPGEPFRNRIYSPKPTRVQYFGMSSG